jgi:hypothetical protein
MKNVLLALIVLGAAGCALSGPTAEQLAQADCGAAPGADYREQIRGWFHETLYDPFSAKYEAGAPCRAWWNAGAFVRDFSYGWGVQVRVNAKNQMGGYTGWRGYIAYFKDGRLAVVQERK